MWQLIRLDRHAMPTGEAYLLPDNTRQFVGRSERCSIVCDSQIVSKVHCELTVNNGTVTVRDLGSRKLTYVNGYPFPMGYRAELAPLDIISLGDSGSRHGVFKEEELFNFRLLRIMLPRYTINLPDNEENHNGERNNLPGPSSQPMA